MTIKICDRCKQMRDPSRFSLTIVTLQYHRGELQDLDWWLGKKETIELCADCLRAVFTRV